MPNKIDTLKSYYREGGVRGVAMLLGHKLRELLVPVLRPIGKSPRAAEIRAERILRALGMADPERIARLRPGSCWDAEKARFVMDCVERTEAVAGDIAELGVYRGGGSLLIAERLAKLGSARTLWCFDSFEGFPSIQEEDRMSDGGMHAEKATFVNTSAAEVRGVLSLNGLAGRARIVKGRFEKSLPRLFGRRRKDFSLAIIDCDLYEGARFCIQWFYDRVPPGGIVAFDDYGVPGRLEEAVYPGVKRAVDEFMADKAEKLVHGAESMWYFVRGQSAR